MVGNKPIKVVQIFDDRELAINAGTNRGITPGAVLRIVTGKPHQVRDPESGEVLGEIVRTKAVVRVYEAQEKFALARTFRTETVNIGGQGAFGTNAFNRLFEAPKYVTRVETLRRAPDEGQPLDEEDSVVEIGDVAEIVKGGDVDDIPSLTTWR